MRTNKEGIDLIKEFEGVRLVAYQDQGGVWTIGYGHAQGDVKPGETILKEQAAAMLVNDIAEFERQVTKLLTIKVSDNQFSALISFAFNLGAGTLRRSSLLRHVNQGYFEMAADDFLNWNKVHGVVVEGLTRRRIAEKALFEKKISSI